jgi:hypothetical protein
MENEKEKLEEVKKMLKNDEIFSKLDDKTLLESINAMENLSPEDIEKYKQYQQTVISMGIPTCRIMMHTLLEKSESIDTVIKAQIFQKIEQLTNFEKVGGMNIEYDDSDTGKKTFFYIIMNKCDKDHDLNEQFNKIKRFFTEETWKQLLKHISMLIYLCRSIYKINIQSCADDMFQLGYDINDVETLKIDPTNTTLYLFEEWDERMGIYIMRECDLEEETSAAINEENKFVEESIKDADAESIFDADVESIKDADVESIKDADVESIKDADVESIKDADVEN